MLALGIFFYFLAKQLEAHRKTSTFSQPQEDSLAMHRTSTGDSMMEEDPHENAKQLEERRQKLLQRQQELIEQKRQVLKEQEEIGKVIQSQKEKLYGIDRENDQALYAEEETRVKRFMKLANALYVCDQDQSGKSFFFSTIQYDALAYHISLLLYLASLFSRKASSGTKFLVGETRQK